MFTHLTGQTRRVLQIAHQEAFARNHDCLGTEHLLLAMLRESSGEAARILQACRVDTGQLQETLELELVPGTRTLDIERLPLALAAQRVIEDAQAHARAAHQTQAGLEHLLLALVREEDSQAAQFLERAGLSPERCRTLLASRSLAGNRDHLVQAELPALPGKGRDPSAVELEDRISADILPREWHAGAPSGLTLVDVTTVEAQLRNTQMVLGGLLGGLTLFELYGWPTMGAGVMLGIMIAAFQSSVLGGLFGGLAGFWIGHQYIALSRWIVIGTTLGGLFLGSWLGNAWRGRPKPPLPPPDPEP